MKIKGGCMRAFVTPAAAWSPAKRPILCPPPIRLSVSCCEQGGINLLISCASLLKVKGEAPELPSVYNPYSSSHSLF
jgi:hypothetical protein